MKHKYALERVVKYVGLCQETGQKHWEKAFSILASLLRESSPKKRLGLLDQLTRALVLCLKPQLARGTARGTGLETDHLQVFTKGICGVYVGYLSNLRLFQRLQKVFKFIYDINAELVMTILATEIEQILTSGQKEQVVDVASLEDVSILIDNCSLGRACIEQKLDIWLQSITQCCRNTTKKAKDSVLSELVSDQHVCQVVIKSILQLFQYFPTKVKNILFAVNVVTDDSQNMASIIVSLTDILYSKSLDKKCVLLSGTAMVLLLNVFPTQDHAVDILIQLMTHAGVEQLACTSEQSHNKCAVGNVEVTLPPSEYLPLTQLAILQGLVTSARRDTILLSLTSLNKQTFLEDVLFCVTYKLCREVKIPVLHYLAFKVMKKWFHCVKQHIHAICKKSSVFGHKSHITSQVLELIWDSLEDPVEGVPACARAIFSLLLEVHALEHHAKPHTNYDTIYESLVDQVLSDVPWHVKARYGLLCDLLPHVGLQMLLDKRPTLLDEMAQCLNTNQLSAACTETFKAFLLYSRKDRTSGAEHFKDLWDLKWKGILLRSLTSDDSCQPNSQPYDPTIFSSSLTVVLFLLVLQFLRRSGIWMNSHDKLRLLQQHARLYWLPCVLRCIPQSLESLLHQLARDHLNTLDNKTGMLACLSVLKAARSLGVLQAKLIDEVLLRRALEHAEDDVRGEALGVVSSSHKTAEPLSSLEIRLLRDFLPHNLSIACPAFRQDLFVAMRKVLTRTRDSSVIALRQTNPKMFSKSCPDCDDLAQVEMTADIKQSLEFVRWMSDVAVNSLLPGASYQRQKTALELLFILLQTFLAQWNPDKKKGQPPEACETLILLLEHKGFWDLTSPRNTTVLLGCLESAHGDIRELAVSILQDHFPAPFKSTDVAVDDSKYAVQLMQKAAALMRSPKAQECESGSALCQVLYEKYVSKLGWQLAGVLKSSDLPIDLPSADSGCCIVFMTELLNEVEFQFSAAKSNLADAAERTPIHGALLAMCRCVCSILDGMTSGNPVLYREHAFVTSLNVILHRTVCVAISTIEFMLGILSGKHDSDKVCGASFAGMGEALEDVLVLSATEDGEDISQQHRKELIVSCCFLNVKVACSLLSSVAERVTVDAHRDESGGTLSIQDMANIGRVFMTIYTQCRHWGVLLSCKASLMKTCRRLTNSSVRSLNNLPKTWLDHVINVISTDKAGSSVTRRSAGLPALIVNVLTCEAPSNRQSLLKQCIDSLMQIASSPLPDVIDQTTDLPQVHAINILRMLYQDTCLGSDVLQHAEQGVVLAINGFASPSWAVRNAATQLYGSLVLRILGHKRGQQDESQFNSISARDFFTRFPSLCAFFLRHFQSSLLPGSSHCAHAHQSGLKPELFPILTLFSKLRPATTNREERFISDFVPVLTPLSSSPVFAVRVLAAQALVPFIPIGGFVDKMIELLQSLPTSPQAASQNTIHGTLLQVRKLAAATRISCVTRGTAAILTELNNTSWLGAKSNTCPLTRAEYMSVVTELAPLLTDKMEETLCFVRGLLDPVFVPSCHRVSVGLPCLQRVLAKMSMDMVFNELWCRGVGQEDRVRVTNDLLSSEEHETRLAALECLQHYTRSSRTALDTVLCKEITSLVLREPDQRCLLVALEIFTNIQGDVKGEEDMCPLWSSLLAYCQGSRGLAVAATAIPACSTVLQSVLQRVSLCEFSYASEHMLAEWSELIRHASTSNQPEPLRLGAAVGLSICGTAILQAGQCKREKQFAGACSGEKLMDAVVSVFVMGTVLLEDEQEEIRITAAMFGSKVPLQRRPCPSESSSCSVAMGNLFEFMSRELWWSSSVWVAMETMVRGYRSVLEVLTEYKKSRCTLFEQEDSNMYAEPFITLQLACKHLKVIVDRVNNEKSQDGNQVKAACCDWLISLTDKLACDIKAVSDAGLMDSGSLQNPKPFCMWYRLTLMADVIEHAVSRLGDPVSAHYDGHLRRILGEFLLNKKQVMTSTHPVLAERARGLALV